MHHPDTPLQRGIYRLPFLSRFGRRMLVAVDRRGRFVSRALLLHDESEAVVGSMLERILDQEDSVPA